MVSQAEVAEINTYFRNRMDESKKIWASRGKEARIAALNARAAQSPPTWRQLKGVPLMLHEIGHVGNRPFMIGFGVSAVIALWVQTKFTDEMKESSPYWSQFHLKKAPAGH
ncbi:hypothetical protein ACHAWO_007543 [Cyclotella atomus]|jgi:hypothetical protein|uniref:Uncharacterized protein n=1 Tax=Cyclotella atomus TaxID=382360 RepID=A0ABD3P9A3_9STRA